PSNPSPPLHLNNLYLYASHTGAGLNDPLFTAARASAIPGFLNATDPAGAFQEFDLGNYWPYGFSFVYEPYAGWGAVQVNAGQGNAQGFGFVEVAGESVLVVESGTGEGEEWGGWLVCDWWHNAPQLFWRYNYYTPEDYPAPSSCADVDLVQVLI
ncbi:hypothetical protein AOQ84DRAFT_90519, partial [Glonium stellatum]